MASEEGWTSLRLNPRQENLVERLRRDRVLSVSALADKYQEVFGVFFLTANVLVDGHRDILFLNGRTRVANVSLDRLCPQHFA